MTSEFQTFGHLNSDTLCVCVCVWLEEEEQIMSEDDDLNFR